MKDTVIGQQCYMAQIQASAEAAKARAFAMQQARRALGEQDSEKGSAAGAGSSGAGGSDAGGEAA